MKISIFYLLIISFIYSIRSHNIIKSTNYTIDYLELIDTYVVLNITFITNNEITNN